MTRRLLIVALLLVGASLAFGPWVVRAWWADRSSNPVRRGVALAGELGCFSCHGEAGREGIADPGHPQGVPAWSGGVWMMYVSSDEEIRRIILDGRAPERPGSQPIAMPGYADRLGGSDLDDLVAAFRVLAGMQLPPSGSLEREGLDLARRWDCFACHGPAGSGGLPNPGSFTGFVPGWYGADFADLVRDRDEFDRWVREGAIPRLADSRLAALFLERQKLQMPAYRELTAEELDALWAYVRWLDATAGGSVPAATSATPRSPALPSPG